MKFIQIKFVQEQEEVPYKRILKINVTIRRYFVKNDQLHLLYGTGFIILIQKTIKGIISVHLNEDSEVIIFGDMINFPLCVFKSPWNFK